MASMWLTTMREDNHLLEWSRVSKFVVLDSFNSTWTRAWLLFPSVEFQRFPEGRKRMSRRLWRPGLRQERQWRLQHRFRFYSKRTASNKWNPIWYDCFVERNKRIPLDLSWCEFYVNSWSVINRTKIPLVRSTRLFAKLLNNEESTSSLGLLDDGSLAPLWAIFVIICVGREGQQPHSWATTSAMDFSEQ